VRTVVVGSGATGLCSAALLSRLGHEVHVLEASELVGGHARTLEIEGSRWCVGPQYVWNFERGGTGSRLLDFLGLTEEVPFDPLDPEGWEQVQVADGEPLRVPLGIEPWIECLSERFPEDAKGLERLGRFVRHTTQVTDYIERTAAYLGPFPLAVARTVLRPEIPLAVKADVVPRCLWTAERLFDECGLSPAARRTVYGHGAIFAEPWSEVSAVVFAGATGTLHQGVRVPRHGFRSLVAGLVRTIEAAGGSVQTGARVERIEVLDGRARRVHCTDGRVLDGERVLSNLTPAATRRLLGVPEAPGRYQPSHSLLALCLAVSGYDLSTLRGRHAWWHRADRETDYRTCDPDPASMVYAGCPSFVGPDNRNEDPERHSLVVFATDSYEESRAARAAGPAAVEERRGRQGEAVLDVLDRHVLPGIGPHARIVRILDACDHAEQVGAEWGSVYGRRMTPASLARRVPWSLPGVRDLWLGSATVGFAGIAQCFRTAQALVEAMTGERLPSD